MQYIQTSNNHFVLSTKKGLVHVTNRSFNFCKIKKLLKENAEEEDILPLLVSPKLTDGVYEVFLEKTSNTLYYKHFPINIADDTYQLYTLHSVNGSTKDMPVNTQNDESNYMSIHTSVKDIMENYPEYFI